MVNLPDIQGVCMVFKKPGWGGVVFGPCGDYLDCGLPGGEVCDGLGGTIFCGLGEVGWIGAMVSHSEYCFVYCKRNTGLGLIVQECEFVVNMI